MKSIKITQFSVHHRRRRRHRHRRRRRYHHHRRRRHHHHHHRLSLTHGGLWGTTDDFRTSFLHFSPRNIFRTGSFIALKKSKTFIRCASKKKSELTPLHTFTFVSLLLLLLLLSFFVVVVVVVIVVVCLFVCLFYLASSSSSSLRPVPE